MEYNIIFNEGYEGYTQNRSNLFEMFEMTFMIYKNLTLANNEPCPCHNSCLFWRYSWAHCSLFLSNKTK